MLRKHLMPHLSNFVTVLFHSEIAQTLWLVGQLGMLYLFIGGTKLDMGGGNPEMMPADWAGIRKRNEQKWGIRT